MSYTSTLANRAAADKLKKLLDICGHPAAYVPASLTNVELKPVMRDASSGEFQPFPGHSGRSSAENLMPPRSSLSPAETPRVDWTLAMEIQAPPTPYPPRKQDTYDTSALRKTGGGKARRSGE
jgi:hypothetical protein